MMFLLSFPIAVYSQNDYIGYDEWAIFCGAGKIGIFDKNN